MNVSTPGAHEKARVATLSVLAAIVLTAAKLAAGVGTGSLGILSEAAHSGLDLVAAVMTVFAVRASARPADENHPYGHGKFENLSALLETLLLMVTCLWIIHEAVLRLFFRASPVRSSLAGFIVLLGSIAIDYGRSTALLRVARKYQSQALEADALHFSTDVWSSIVVVFGLGMVGLSNRLGIPWLAKGDAVAALGVAGIVIGVSLRLGRKTLDDLLDSVPTGKARQIQTLVLGVPGVLGVRRFRLRKSGGAWFSDLTIEVSSDSSFQASHTVADAVEEVVNSQLKGADCVVHVEPCEVARTRDDPGGGPPGSAKGKG